MPLNYLCQRTKIYATCNNFFDPLSRMGTAIVAPVLALLTPRPRSLLPNPYSHKFSNGQNDIAWRGSSSSIKAGGRVGGPEWEKTHYGKRSAYHDDFNYNYDDEEFGFRKNSGKQRIWWSDDSATNWGSDSGDEDDDGDDDDEDGFGVLEGSMGGFSSIFKLFRAFGWIVPAIIASMLLGTGANAFVMALALPLAQSALSSVLDMIWERSPDSPRPKSRSQNRKKAYSGAASGSRMREERDRSAQNGKSSDNYRSWVATGNVSAGKAEGRARSFGGWDELDKQRRKERERKAETGTEKGWQTQGKLSRRSRKRQTSLLVRLLIAFFPFLGFWTKLW